MDCQERGVLNMRLDDLNQLIVQRQDAAVGGGGRGRLWDNRGHRDNWDAGDVPEVPFVPDVSDSRQLAHFSYNIADYAQIAGEGRAPRENTEAGRKADRLRDLAPSRQRLALWLSSRQPQALAAILRIVPRVQTRKRPSADTENAPKRRTRRYLSFFECNATALLPRPLRRGQSRSDAVARGFSVPREARAANVVQRGCLCNKEHKGRPKGGESALRPLRSLRLKVSLRLCVGGAFGGLKKSENSPLR